MTNTLGKEILRRYLTLKDEVEKEVGVFPLPKIPDELSVSDFVVMICFFFSSSYDSGDYHSALRRGMGMKGIVMTDEEFEKAYPKVEEFLNWLIPLLRTP